MENIFKGQKMLVNKRGAFDWGHRGVRAGDKVVVVGESFESNLPVEVEFLEIRGYHDLHEGSRGGGTMNRFFLRPYQLEIKEEYESV